MSQALATQNQKAPIIADKGTLETLMSNGTFQDSLKKVLPLHLTPERVVKMALIAASRQPKLFQCTRESVLQSIMKSAELGLDCSGTVGRAYLVPYWNSKISAYEAQFLVGYQGLIELARRSGNIARIESRVVYEKDAFVVEYGLSQKLVHTPSLIQQRGDMQCVYAIAEMMDGSRQLEVMTIAEVESIRNRSKAGESGPWKTDYSEMARKTVIRRLAKYLPLATEVQHAIGADDDQYSGQFQDNAAEMAAHTKGRVVELRERLAQPPTPETPEPQDYVDSTIHETPADPDPIDPLESKRANVKEQFDQLSKSRQKELIPPGNNLIPEMNEAELDELSAAIEAD